jgi:protocatechuate 3,4-dioxygenase beta subunit
VLDDGNGEPVRRARVTGRVTGSSYDYSTLTDEDGRWSLSGLPAGRYSLTVSKPAYITTYHGSLRPGRPPGSPVSVGESARVTDLVTRLQRGGVISGSVLDETGQPLTRANLQVWQVQMSGTERRLAPVQGSTSPVFAQIVTDDRGEYRIYGLPEGTFYVSATVPMPTTPDIRRLAPEELKAIESEAGRAAQSAGAVFQPMTGRPVGFAPIFHPSAVVVDAAAGIVLAPGMERAGVDIVARLVPTSVIRGRVVGPDGQPPTGVRLMLATYQSGGITIGGFSQRVVAVAADGTFTTESLSPARYTLWARGLPSTATLPASGPPPGIVTSVLNGVPVSTTGSLPLFGDEDVDVTGDELPEVILRLEEGAKVSGTVVFEGDAPRPALENVRLSLSALSPSRMASGGGSSNPQADGTFAIQYVPPGEYRANAFLGFTSVPSGGTGSWAVKSILYQGRDVLDQPFEVRQGVNVEGLTAVFTTKMPELSGTITDAAGRPVPDLMIVLFSANRADWRTGSRRNLPGVQPDTAGRFLFGSVPPGDYYLAAVATADRNDLADASFLEAVVPAAIKVTIADGEKKVQDLRIAGGK